MALVKKMNHMSGIFRISHGLCLGGLIAFSTAVCGQTTIKPQGGEFTIIGNVPGDQVWPSVSLNSTAGVIDWQDNRIDKLGVQVGGALLNSSFAGENRFRANKTETGNHLQPKVQLLANGNIIFVWQCTVSGVPGIYARFAKGTTTKTSTSYGTNFYTADIRVNTYVKGDVSEPEVAALPDGSAILTWSSYGEDGSLYGVYARKLKSTGAASGAEFKVNQFTLGNQHHPAVAALANGNYIIVWASENERGANSVDIYGRIYTSAGVPLSDELPINSGISPCSSPSVAALTDGGFTVVWAQKDLIATTNGWDIWGRAFSPNGMPKASDFRINTFLYGDQYQPKIATGPAASMVIWTSLGEDGSKEGVYARILAAGTQPAGDEFRVNTTTLSQQMHPAVAWDGVGHFLAVWTSFTGTTTQGFDLFGQLYAVTSSP
jgi:hypothetical protein